MRSIIIDEKFSEKRIDKIITRIFTNMPVGAMYKAFRKKDIKVNGKRVKEDYIVKLGDKVEIYIIDDILNGKGLNSCKEDRLFKIVYEDKNILIVNKMQGIPVHPDREQSEDTLIDKIKDYLIHKGEYNIPSLCHRLDRNTGGLVIIAKNDESLKILLDKIKNKEIKKYYQCLVKGKMEKNFDVLKAYLIKNEKQSKVFISDTKLKDSLEIITKYNVLSYKDYNMCNEKYQNIGISRLEVELVTGRTHQIRAHLAHIGHPILGDGKYGINMFNRLFNCKYFDISCF